MALFKKKAAADDGSLDETLTFLSAAAAGRLRAELAAAFAEQGLEMQVFSDRLVDAEGRVFGVHNVAATCFNDDRGEKAWPEIIRDHVRRIVAGMDAPPVLEAMTPDEIRAALTRGSSSVRASPRDALPRTQSTSPTT